MLCPPGSFCASGAAAAGGRRLLQQHEQQQECPAGQMSGAGAVACVADCGRLLQLSQTPSFCAPLCSSLYSIES